MAGRFPPVVSSQHLFGTEPGRRGGAPPPPLWDLGEGRLSPRGPPGVLARPRGPHGLMAARVDPAQVSGRAGRRRAVPQFPGPGVVLGSGGRPGPRGEASVSGTQRDAVWKGQVRLLELPSVLAGCGGRLAPPRPHGGFRWRPFPKP